MNAISNTAIPNAAISNPIPNDISREILTLEASFKGASLERLKQSIAKSRSQSIVKYHKITYRKMPKQAGIIWLKL
jgi:hypothetical protein